ncbi:YbdD/YjiX family protein [Rothia sp. LK2588]|uniref:YbdD/YjiX family protein n=1 Tax=Rothia sp. LK2588 TaxID=3114369 RepID=UPI0034CFFE54
MQTIKELFGKFVWFANGVLGADRYQKYLAYHRQSGCDHAPMTEKEFWRDYTDRMEKNPGSRCC